jgi:hypothetical protein
MHRTPREALKIRQGGEASTLGEKAGASQSDGSCAACKGEPPWDGFVFRSGSWAFKQPPVSNTGFGFDLELSIKAFPYGRRLAQSLPLQVDL